MKDWAGTWEKEGEDGQFWQAVSTCHEEGSAGPQLHSGLYSSDNGLEMVFFLGGEGEWEEGEECIGYVIIFLMH